MDIDKLNIQSMSEDLYNTIEVGECFENRDELNYVISDLYKLIDELFKYDGKKFEI